MIVPIGLPGEIQCLSPGNWYKINSAYRTMEEETNLMYGSKFSFDILALMACGNKNNSDELLREGLFTAEGFVVFFFFITPA